MDAIKEMEAIVHRAVGALLTSKDKDNAETADRLSHAWIALRATTKQEPEQTETAGCISCGRDMDGETDMVRCWACEEDREQALAEDDADARRKYPRDF